MKLRDHKNKPPDTPKMFGWNFHTECENARGANSDFRSFDFISIEWIVDCLHFYSAGWTGLCSQHIERLCVCVCVWVCVCLSACVCVCLSVSGFFMFVQVMLRGFGREYTATDKLYNESGNFSSPAGIIVVKLFENHMPQRYLHA